MTPPSGPGTESADKSRRRVSYLVEGGVIAALLVMGAVALVNYTGEAPAPAPQPSADPSAAPSTAAIPQPVELLDGTDTADGFPVGFPRTSQGAVSAAAAFATESTVLEPQAKAEASKVYIQGAQETPIEELSAGAANSIDGLYEWLGVDPDALSPDVDLTVEPVGVDYNEVSYDTVAVSILLRVALTDGTEPVAERFRTHPLRMTWDEEVRGGDWVFMAMRSSRGPTAATPGTTEFTDEGWHKVRTGD